MSDANQLPPEQHLDFWLGDWDVTWGENGRGSNRIERILDDKIIQENFDGNPSMPFQGKSWSVYNPKLGRWQQTWVDNNSTYWHFEGGFEGDEMILATDDLIDGRPIKLRMVFYNIGQNELDWRWERSDDGGETWALQWQLRYTRK